MWIEANDEERPEQEPATEHPRLVHAEYWYICPSTLSFPVDLGFTYCSTKQY